MIIGMLWKLSHRYYSHYSIIKYFYMVIHVYSFVYSFTYTRSYTHSRILIHVYSFLYFLSFVIIFWLYVIIIIYNLTTLCVHDRLPFIFIFMFQFVFIFHITLMFHEHIYTCCIFYIFLVSCLLHMALHMLVKYDVYEITPHS